MYSSSLQDRNTDTTASTEVATEESKTAYPFFLRFGFKKETPPPNKKGKRIVLGNLVQFQVEGLYLVRRVWSRLEFRTQIALQSKVLYKLGS